MKLKQFAILLFLSALLFNCTIEHDDDLIVQLAGKWKLISITFDGVQQITSCDKTTVSEFISDGDPNKGNYTGTVYFWTEALDSCDPETFRGKWKWDDDEVLLNLTINGTTSNINYSNDFDITYIYSDGADDDDIADKIYFTFKNEDEEFERIYLYERIF